MNAFSCGAYYKIELAPTDNIGFDDAASKMRALTMASVKKRLVSDVPIGSFLSGGLDSSVIAFCAKQFTPDLKTYSIGFKDEPIFDETRYAEQMAGHIGSDHTSFILTNDDLLDHLDEMLDYIDEPFADSSAIPVSILSKNTKDHISVALSGDGGDELLGGYNKHKAEYLSRNKGLALDLIGALSPVWKALPKSRNWRITNLFRQLDKLSIGLNLNNKERYWLWCCYRWAYCN
ncbi:MAG TPA: asparagine synthase [Bacteroidetes bacterium]|nr:asparagine synthase [Bacteroidota bacterium]